MTKTNDEFVQELEQINNRIQVIGKYTRAQERVKVRCLDCGKEWEPYAHSLLQGKGCPHCSAILGAKKSTGKTKTKNKEDFIKEIKVNHPNIEIIGEYINNKTPIKCFCKRCNNTWEVRPYSLTQGHGCPRCAKSGTSFMEQYILKCMQRKFGIENVLSRDKKIIGLELDIYIPERNFAIEPGNWFLHKNRLEYDSRKRSLCKQKGVTLLTIYDKYPKDQKPPFKNNCIVFEDDYNISNHKHIKELVLNIFEYLGETIHFNQDDWREIEIEAYKDSLSMTQEEFKTKMKTINPDIEVLGEYKNTNIRIKVKCKKCGFEWDGVPANLLSGDGCRKCGTKKAHSYFLKKQEDFINELKKINPTIEIIGQYKGRHSKIKAHCKICGYEWEPIASSLLRGSSHKDAKAIHKKLTNNK